MVTYYVTLFISLLINYLPHHIFCLCGMYVTTYVTPTMPSLRLVGDLALGSSPLPEVDGSTIVLLAI